MFQMMKKNGNAIIKVGDMNLDHNKFDVGDYYLKPLVTLFQSSR